MAYAEQSPGLHARRRAEESRALAREWRSLSRAATFVAILTAPAFFLLLWKGNGWDAWVALLITVFAVLMFRGAVEVLSRRFLPSPSLYGIEDELREEDAMARRRVWYWRTRFRRLAWLVVILFLSLVALNLLLRILGVSAPLFDTLSAARDIYGPQLPNLLLLLLQLPLLFVVNFLIFFGPFVFFAVRQIRAYEPGEADWGVRLEDVRGQAEAKEEVTRVISLWQSGEEFERAGGKRERGLLFLGAPGTGKTMLSKAIATSFNCPFVTIPGSGFAGMFIGMDAITVQYLARRAKKLAGKWGGQCIVFIDEIDAVGMRRNALGPGGGFSTAAAGDLEAQLLSLPGAGELLAQEDAVVHTRARREWEFAQRTEYRAPNAAQRLGNAVSRFYPGFGGSGFGGGMALNQLLVVMDGIDDPPLMRRWFTRRFNTFLDATFVIPQKIGKRRLRLSPPKPRSEQIYFIGACNVPIEVLDPALTRPGRMGRHIWFRTPTLDDRKDILDLYINKVAHEPELDTDHRRDELARMTSGYSPSMIEQVCSMALTLAHSEGRQVFGRQDIVEAMTTVETGTAVAVEYTAGETRAVAIHEAGHAVASRVFMPELQATRLSIRKRGGSLGHYQGTETEERFSRMRGELIANLVMTLGAMAAEHVFYRENSEGVGGDVRSATARAALMVGAAGMGPARVDFGDRFEDPEQDEMAQEAVVQRFERIGKRIMNRLGGGGPFAADPIASVLGDPFKRNVAAQILGQAYMHAYTLMAANKPALDFIADRLIERREMHGDEVVDMLDEAGIVVPEVDLLDESVWPRI